MYMLEFTLHINITPVSSEEAPCACQACDSEYPSDLIQRIASNYVAEQVAEHEEFPADGLYCPCCRTAWEQAYPEPSIEDINEAWFERSRGFRMMDRDTLLSPNNGL